MKRRQFIAAAAAGGAGLPVLASSNGLGTPLAGAANDGASSASPGAPANPAALPGSGRPGAAMPPRGLILANLRTPDGPHLAVRVEQGLLDVVAAAQSLGLRVPRTTDALLNEGEGELRACLAKTLSLPVQPWLSREDHAAFAPAITNPQKLICVGLNYRRHAHEVGLAEPKAPILFNKFNNALTHHRATVPTQGLPGSHFDYEGELVIVMGRRCVNVSEEHALDYVYGYCTGNDFSERTYQMITSQWMAGKSSDGFAPLGPYLVSADLVGNPNALKLETHVNGELRQSSNTADFIFNCQQIIAFASRVFPLEPGDLIYTGTPEGVILGMPKDRQVWLKTGDKVVVTIEKLGALEITVG